MPAIVRNFGKLQGFEKLKKCYLSPCQHGAHQAGADASITVLCIIWDNQKCKYNSFGTGTPKKGSHQTTQLQIQAVFLHTSVPLKAQSQTVLVLDNAVCMADHMV